MGSNLQRCQDAFPLSQPVVAVHADCSFYPNDKRHAVLAASQQERAVMSLQLIKEHAAWGAC